MKHICFKAFALSAAFAVSGYTQANIGTSLKNVCTDTVNTQEADSTLESRSDYQSKLVSLFSKSNCQGQLLMNNSNQLELSVDVSELSLAEESDLTSE